MKDTEHRTFILTLDADHGQELAHEAGFTRPSVDVEEREQRQVLKDWATLDAEGTIPQLIQYAHWFCDIVVPDEATMEERLSATHSFVSFAAAAIARLKVKGLLETPATKRLVPVVQDKEGNQLDTGIPEELLEYAAEMHEWQHRGDPDEPR